MAFTTLRVALADLALDLGLPIPWLKWKHWLQYIFDRFEDRTEDGEITMGMVLKQ
jgi:hypothetical protein